MAIPQETKNTITGLPYQLKEETQNPEYENLWDRVKRERQEGHHKYLGGKHRPSF